MSFDLISSDVAFPNYCSLAEWISYDVILIVETYVRDGDLKLEAAV